MLVDADGRLKKILSASLAPSVKTSAEGTITLVNQIQNNLDQIQANLKNLKTPPAGTKIKDLVISAYKLQSAFRFQITRAKDVIKSASQLPPTDDPAKDILKLVDELQSENKLGKNLLEFCKLRRDCVKSRVRWIIPEDHPGRGRARVRTNHRH